MIPLIYIPKLVTLEVRQGNECTLNKRNNGFSVELRQVLPTSKCHHNRPELYKTQRRVHCHVNALPAIADIE